MDIVKFLFAGIGCLILVFLPVFLGLSKGLTFLPSLIISISVYLVALFAVIYYLNIKSRA